MSTEDREINIVSLQGTSTGYNTLFTFLALLIILIITHNLYANTAPDNGTSLDEYK